jgi:hypothetical protein
LVPLANPEKTSMCGSMQTMSEFMANSPDAGAALPAAWDPFQLMDRLDEEALRRELDGVPSDELVYVVKQGGREVVGLSKSGVDQCCVALVAQGQVIREEELQYEVIGEGGSREALFKVKAARYAVSPEGREVRLDQVIGVKRQPLYHESQKLNPHWYEAGAMKAARNARFRLLPSGVRAQVIASARQSGQARVIEDRATLPVETAARVGPYAPTEKQVAFYQRLAESPVFTAEERRRALEWLATRATRQTIKDQIDWLKRQVETRKASNAGASAA